MKTIYPEIIKKIAYSLSFALAATALLSNCVSQKKYDSALEEIGRLSVDSTFQEYEITDAKFKRDDVIYNQQDELENKSQKLDSIQSILQERRNQAFIRRDLINELRKSNWNAKELNGNIVIELKDDIIFGIGSSELSPSGKQTIKEISGSLLNIDEAYELRIIGHTDNIPFKSNFNDNWNLSAQRALTVTRSLIQNKIDPSIIMAAAKGKYDPQEKNESSDDRELNRRTEIILIPNEFNYQTIESIINK